MHPAPDHFILRVSCPNFFLDVDDQQRGLVWIDQHCPPLAWEKA